MKLKLPEFEYRVKKSEGQNMIFDIIRKKYIVLTPEEWVRQHLIHFFINQCNYPPTLISVEREININGLRRRFDLVIYKDSQPWIIVECKAPSVTLTQAVFDQVFCYNTSLQAPYIAISNGIDNICVALKKDGTYSIIPYFPAW